jgi:hypothetical protein
MNIHNELELKDKIIDQLRQDNMLRLDRINQLTHTEADLLKIIEQLKNELEAIKKKPQYTYK